MRRVDRDILFGGHDHGRDQQDARTQFGQPSVTKRPTGAAIGSVPSLNLIYRGAFGGDQSGNCDLDADLVTRKMSRSCLGELFEHGEREGGGGVNDGPPW